MSFDSYWLTQNGSVPTLGVLVNDKRVRVLIDTGCTVTLIRSGLSSDCRGTSTIRAVDGQKVACRGISTVTLEICGQLLNTEAIVMEKMIDVVDIIMGMDVILELGGVIIKENGNMEFRGGDFATSIHLNSMNKEKIQCEVEDNDFSAKFEGMRWTVDWKWTLGTLILKNNIDRYYTKLTEGERVDCDNEFKRWIAEGILVPWDQDVKVGGLPGGDER